MLEILRNLWRRKFRTLLTIFGIAIGIFAFTVMGSMALKLNKMIDGGKKYITGQITIAPKGTDFMMGQMGAMLPVDTLNKIDKVEGVEAVTGGIEMSLDEPNPDDPASMSFGIPATIEGMDLKTDFKNRNWETMEMKEGRMIKEGDPDDVIAIGSTIALDKKWKLDDKVKIRGREFKVIGILDKTMSGPDSYVFMSLDSTRELYVESNPFLKSLKEQQAQAASISVRELASLPKATRDQIMQAKAFKMEDLSTMGSVSWKDGVNSEDVANRIKDQFKDEVIVLSPKKMGEEIDKASAMMNAVILGGALLALLVGSFSVINTMIMSISERTREIGIKKSLGASNRSIALEYALEAGVIGTLGGLLGIGIGVLLIVVFNNKMAETGAEIFLLDFTFLLQVLIFSFVLGIVAGIMPAIKAAKMKVIKAIREM
ncbi:MAG: ABC transporter permease [Patescibacteria group bacterium]|nr:ABC transporter permease [Patescibacteria group bacterium]